MKNDITAIWLWKHPAADSDASVRLEATVSTPELMTKADLIAEDNVDELVEQDDRIVAIDVFICDNVGTAKILRDTVLETYRIRGLDETTDIWPDTSVGQLEGGEGVLLLQGYEDHLRADGKIRLHDRRTPDTSPGLDKRYVFGSWTLSRTEISGADCWEPQYQAAQRAARRISAQVCGYDPRMSGIVAQEVQMDIEKNVYGAIVGAMDVKTEDFDDDLLRPENDADGRALQADLLQACEDLSEDLHAQKSDLKLRILDKMRENGSRFVASVNSITP